MLTKILICPCYNDFFLVRGVPIIQICTTLLLENVNVKTEIRTPPVIFVVRLQTALTLNVTRFA